MNTSNKRVTSTGPRPATAELLRQAVHLAGLLHQHAAAAQFCATFAPVPVADGIVNYAALTPERIAQAHTEAEQLHALLQEILRQSTDTQPATLTS